MLHRFQIRKTTVSILFVTVLLLYVVCNVFFTGYSISEPISCYRVKDRETLPDILSEKPPPDKSIFFLETSCKSIITGKIEISARQACAVESAALMNPTHQIYLLYTSPGLIKNEETLSDRLLQALTSYENVKIMHIDYEAYSNGTPLENIYKERKVETSKFANSHASDVLRYLTLWRFSGIYLDLDVVVIKSLENLPKNFAGAESDENVAAGVLKFDSGTAGRHFAQMCVDDLKHSFNGYDWGNNGPGVITRLLRKVCKAKRAKQMLNKDCQGFKVYPPETFYVVPWKKWGNYFDPQYNEKLLKMTNNSYAIHVWNRFSINVKVDVKTDVPYSIFAKRFCPRVFAQCDQYF